MELSPLDRKILYYLDQNSRQSLSHLAKKLKKGRNVILYRINQLKERAIIKNSFAEINNSLLGYYNFRLLFKIENSTDEEILRLSNFIKKQKGITFFSKVLGKWDFDLVFTSKKIIDFEKFRETLFIKFNKIINDSEISVQKEIYYYPKDFLIKEKKSKIEYTLVGLKESLDYQCDEKDEQILTELSKDASLNLISLSTKTKLSINTLKKRIKNLEKKKIILGYRLFIDPTKFGYEYYKLHIKLKDYQKDDLLNFRGWIGKKVSLVYIDHYINGADFEIELIFEKEGEYISFLDELNKEFGKIIKEKYLLKFYDLETFAYLPQKRR